MPDPEDYLTTERIGLISWWLADGETPTTRQVADRLGISYAGAWSMLQKLARVLPICYDENEPYEGYWFRIREVSTTR
jgi:hypothetical protein